METQRMTRQTATRLSPVWELMTLMLLVMPGAGRAADVSLAVDASVQAGTCDVLINTSGSGQTAAGTATASLALTEETSNVLEQGLEPDNLKPVTIQLSNCQGVRSGSAAAPFVKVSGPTLVAPVKPDKHIFRDSTSTADPRIGIVLALTEHPGAPGSTWTNYAVADETYAMHITSANTPNLNGQAGVSASRDFWIGTSCGNATQCDDSPGGTLTGGNAIAKLTFAFEYK
ncbi:hypothetical protein [Raoultella ornithinolytica]|uniref:hypothetical protein n=1 Tax=Raoultella ornithinolytica TaxID=54291 RepID=UPI0021B07F7A|nr:hypothetical protein [Raoultella ornithinolytica]MCT4737209.1 hypothetical protein [Raoultella ornithinolytica]